MPNGKWADSTRSRRLPKSWPEIRAEVFRVHGHICHVCGGDGAYEVDHVEAGDDHTASNLLPIHGRRSLRRCHVYKSSSEGGKAAQAAKPKRQRPAEKHPGLL